VSTRNGPILVTGAAGFIGSHVAGALARRGERVIGLDNFDPFYSRVLKEANWSEAGGGAVLVEGDFTDGLFVRRVFETYKPAGVIHLGAKAGVRPSLADPAGYMHANVTGTATVLSEASRAGASRVVVASSSSVYGNSPTSPFSETQDVSRPISPYAASKLACEALGHAHHAATGLPVAMLRFFTVYGPRQRPDLAIVSFMRRIAKGEPITLFGDGSTSRDYTFIDDIVAGVLASYDSIPRHGFRVWNLGNNRPVSLAEVVGAIERTVGRSAEVQRAPMQTGDVERTCADIERSRAELGYAPRTGFEDGLARQWEWLRPRV